MTFLVTLCIAKLLITYTLCILLILSFIKNISLLYKQPHKNRSYCWTKLQLAICALEKVNSKLELKKCNFCFFGNQSTQNVPMV